MGCKALVLAALSAQAFTPGSREHALARMPRRTQRVLQMTGRQEMPGHTSIKYWDEAADEWPAEQDGLLRRQGPALPPTRSFPCLRRFLPPPRAESR